MPLRIARERERENGEWYLQKEPHPNGEKANELESKTNYYSLRKATKDVLVCACVVMKLDPI
jgi:hypothetical protein